jgi:hypothetical protein
LERRGDKHEILKWEFPVCDLKSLQLMADRQMGVSRDENMTAKGLGSTALKAEAAETDPERDILTSLASDTSCMI